MVRQRLAGMDERQVMRGKTYHTARQIRKKAEVAARPKSKKTQGELYHGS